MQIIQYIKTIVSSWSSPRYRDRRGFYASGVLSCLRDQYWEMKGEPITDKPDFQGSLNMMVGKWIEDGFTRDILQHGDFFGLHVAGTQVPVGGSNPNWDGYLDALLCERVDGKIKKPVVLELKTSHGFGADKLFMNPTESLRDSYVFQIGLYLKDLTEKNVTSEGILLYLTLSDAHFGDFVAYSCRYEAATKEVVVYKVELLDGRSLPMNLRYNLETQGLARWLKLQEHLDKNEVPPPDYVYKRELTPEFLASCSDNDLKKAINGEKILGDWQPRYSRFFQKILETDKLVREYTAKEIELLRNEYNSRLTPTGRKRKPI